jgi:hypothetical protein
MRYAFARDNLLRHRPDVPKTQRVPHPKDVFHRATLRLVGNMVRVAPPTRMFSRKPWSGARELRRSGSLSTVSSASRLLTSVARVSEWFV